MDTYKIVCFGDSTTDASYTPSDLNFVESYKNLKVYSAWLEEELPKLLLKNVEIINSGVSGDTTFDAKLRFQKDVLNHNPNLVILQFGANDQSIRQDLGLTTPILTIDQFAYNILFFINRLRKKNVEIILMTPGVILWADYFKKNYFKEPYNLDERYGLNENLKHYAEMIRKISKNENVQLIDVYNEEIKFDRTTNKSLNNLLPDGLHPNNDGHKFIANLILNHI